MSQFSILKEAAYTANMQIPVQHLAIYTWGNVSAFDKNAGVFAIKPSGVPYTDLSPDAMVVVDLDGTVVEGTLRPSSDTPTHLELYKDFCVKKGYNIEGIIHTHSSYAVSWAQALCPVPILGTTHADHLQKAVPCTPYLSKEAVLGDYEKETGLSIINHFEALSLNPEETEMVLVGGHGPFCWGKDAQKAVYNAAVLEEICKMALHTKMLSPQKEPLPDYIVSKHYLRKHGKNAYYGQTHQ